MSPAPPDTVLATLADTATHAPEGGGMPVLIALAALFVVLWCFKSLPKEPDE